MRNGIVIAASCIALALGACSGGGSPPSAGSGDGPATGDGPAAGDGSGTEEDTFESASASVEAARAAIDAIEVDAQAAQTDDQQAALRSRIETARDRYLEAIQAVERVVEAAEEGSAEHEAAREYLEGINSVRAGDLARLDAAFAAVTPRAIDGKFTPGERSTEFSPTPATFTWTLRVKAAESDKIPEEYASKTFTSRVVPGDGFDAVQHASGYRLFGEGATSHMLPMRGITLRTELTRSDADRRRVRNRDAGRFPGISAGSQVGAPPANDSLSAAHDSAVFYQVYHSGIQLPAFGTAGPTLKMGGSGATWADLKQRDLVDGCSFSVTTVADMRRCNDVRSDDVTVAFSSRGVPISSTGLIGWRTLLPETQYRKFYQGEYQLYLSRYAGVLRNLEPSNPLDPPHTEDDDHRYLEYAGYGQFLFVDNAVTDYRPTRMQAFHFGYDTFGGDNGQPKDLAQQISAKFTGLASGYVGRDTRRLSTAYPEVISLLYPMRGSVKLDATIGGESHGTVTGTISRIEYLYEGTWGTDIGELVELDEIKLSSAEIKEDGSFAGIADPESSSLLVQTDFGNGEFGGNLYGPNAEEIAGAWYLPEKSGGAIRGVGIMFGSFGARQNPASE